MNTITATKQNIDNSKLEIAYNLLRVTRNKTIKQIIELLSKKSLNQRELLNQMYREFGSESDQTFISTKLTSMQDYDLINVERKGKFIYYSINIATFERITNAINLFINGNKL